MSFGPGLGQFASGGLEVGVEEEGPGGDNGVIPTAVLGVSALTFIGWKS